MVMWCFDARLFASLALTYFADIDNDFWTATNKYQTNLTHFHPAFNNRTLH